MAIENHYQKSLPKTTTENHYQKWLSKITIENCYRKSLLEILILPHTTITYIKNVHY
jgi:hypothetical protein